MIIGFSGFARAGKDTAAKALIDEGWVRVAFADGVREAALVIDPMIHDDTLYEDYDLRTKLMNNNVGVDYYDRYALLSDLVRVMGWDEAKKLKEVRRLLQVIGTEVGREMFGEDTWVNRAMSKHKMGQNTVITDVRFPNESKAIQKLGGIVIKIIRPGVASLNAHASEIGIPDEMADKVIVNGGSIEELHQQIKEIVGI